MISTTKIYYILNEDIIVICFKVYCDTNSSFYNKLKYIDYRKNLFNIIISIYPRIV